MQKEIEMEGTTGKLRLRFYDHPKVNEKFDGCIVLLFYKGKMVMGYHATRKGWEFPGGKMEEGETIEDCGIRESYEETGGVVSELRFLGSYIVDQKQRKIVSAIFTAEAQAIESLPKDSEMMEVGFFDELPQDVTFKDDVYREVLDYIKNKTK